MSLKKIVYLHGLESQQGGQKVDYLSDKGYVFAPEMPYKQNPDLFQDTLEEIKELGEPDLIVGSSMGGYFAYALGTWTNIPIVLLNPALHSRQFEPDNVRHGLLQPRIHCLLGANDTVINPYDTHKILQFEPKCEFMIKKHGHRTPVGMFKKIINSI